MLLGGNFRILTTEAEKGGSGLALELPLRRFWRCRVGTLRGSELFGIQQAFGIRFLSLVRAFAYIYILMWNMNTLKFLVEFVFFFYKTIYTPARISNI